MRTLRKIGRKGTKKKAYMQIFKVKVCNNPQNGFLLERNKRNKTSLKEVFYFVAKLGFVVRIVLIAMTVALRH